MFWSLNAGSGRARCADWLGGPPGQTEIRAARGEGARRSQEAFCVTLSQVRVHVRLITSRSPGLMLPPLIVTILTIIISISPLWPQP